MNRKSGVRKVSYLLENVARSLFEQKRVEEWYMSQHKLIEKGMDFSVRQGFAFTPLSLIATFASSISIGLTLRNIYLDYLEHKPEQLTSHYLLLGINIGTTLSFIGTAAERALDKAVSTKLAEYTEKEMLGKFSQSVLKKMALDEVLEATAWGFARKTLIRFSMPFANSYVGLLLIIGTVAFDLYADVCKERALKSWVKSTPFSLVKVDSSPKDEGELLAEFANVMTQPKAEFAKKKLSQGKVQYFIDFTLPRFDPNHHQLQLCIYSNQLKLHLGQTFGGIYPMEIKMQVLTSENCH